MSVLTIQSKNLYSSLNFLAWESLRCYHELSVVDELFSSWSKVSNYARKVGLGFGVLGYGMGSLFTAPFGIALKQVVTRIADPFTLVKGEVLPKTLQGKQFSVFSANECLMPGGFCLTHGGVVSPNTPYKVHEESSEKGLVEYVIDLGRYALGLDPYETRLDRIIEQILIEDKDVVCLSEVFDEQSSRKIVEALKGRYHVFCFDICPDLALGAGGFFASKFAVEDLDIASFPEETSSMLCKRAYAAFTLTSKGAPFARIFTTHLTSSENDLQPTVSEKQARKIQLELMVKKVRGFIGKDLALLFCGDLNSSREELMSHPDFILDGCSTEGKSKEAVRFLDGNVGKVPTWGGEKGVHPLELDYVFLVKGSAIKVETEVRATSFKAGHFNTKAISDHYPLLSEVVLHKD